MIDELSKEDHRSLGLHFYLKLILYGIISFSASIMQFLINLRVISFVFLLATSVLFFTAILPKTVTAWKLKSYKTIKYLSILSVIVLLIYQLNTMDINQQSLEIFFLSNLTAAKWLYFLICFMQPIILPFPEAVTILAGSSVLGPFSGAIIGFSGTILGIISMFTICKYFGLKIAKRFIKKSSLQKYYSYVKKGETLALILLFIFPLLPDEVICIGAGLSNVSVRKFIIIAVISKLVTSFSIAYSLKLASLSPETIFILFSTIAAVLLFIFVLKRKLKKSHSK